MAKSCPFGLIATSIQLTNPSAYSVLECVGPGCQMWDEERNDCGLKQPAKDKVIVINDGQIHIEADDQQELLQPDEYRSELD